jgi:hypothetical protein
MNYNEFPEIKKNYVPICLDMNIKPDFKSDILKDIKGLVSKPIPEVKVITQTISIPISKDREIFVKEKKLRKKYDLLTYPDHWSDKLKTKYKSYYFRCRQKGKNFSLSFEEFENLFTLPCRFCGSKESITIDRIDSNIGYELFNCQPCCYLCNMMKYTQTEYSFLSQIAKVYNYQLDKY